MDLALNNLQRLICHKTLQTKPKIIIYRSRNREGGSFRNRDIKLIKISLKSCNIQSSQKYVVFLAIEKITRLTGLYVHSYRQPV